MHRRKVREQIVGVTAIDAEIIGSSASAIYRDRTRIVASINQRIAGTDRRHHARLQLQKLIRIARVERQVRNLPRVHHRTQLRARGIHQRRLRGHFDRLFRRANLQHRVHRHHLVQIDVHRALQVLLEAGQVEIHAIGSHRNLRKSVIAVAVRGGLIAHTGSFIG